MQLQQKMLTYYIRTAEYTTHIYSEKVEPLELIPRTFDCFETWKKIESHHGHRWIAQRTE